MKKIGLIIFALLSLVFFEAKANESEINHGLEISELESTHNKKTSDEIIPGEIKTESEWVLCSFELLGNGYDSERFDDIVSESTATRVCRKYVDEVVFCAKESANDEVFARSLSGFYKGIKLCQKMAEQDQFAFETAPVEAP